MHEILILHTLLNGQNTMYGLTKQILKTFGFLTKPSFGTIQPALKRLEKKNYVKSDKFYTEGGKPYFYYSIMPEGKDFLIKKILKSPVKNPVQLYPEIKIKLVCSNILEDNDKKVLYQDLKLELTKLKTESETIQKSNSFSSNSYGRIVLDNTIYEYKNLIDLIEGFEKCLQ